MTRQKRQRPASLGSVTRRLKTGHGTAFITVAHDGDRRPLEVFAALGRAGSCERELMEAVTRAVSIGLRHGVPPGEYVRQLRGIQCPLTIPGTTSVPHALAEALEDFVRRRPVPGDGQWSGQLRLREEGG